MQNKGFDEMQMRLIVLFMCDANVVFGETALFQQGKRA